MEIIIKPISFNCNGIFSPAYGCDKPGDNSGQYYHKEDVNKLVGMIEKLKRTIEDIQGDECPKCHRVKSFGASICTFCDWDVR